MTRCTQARLVWNNFSIFPFLFLFFSIWSFVRKESTSSAEREEKKRDQIRSMCSFLSMCVCLIFLSSFFVFLSFFTGCRWQIDPLSRRVVSNFLSVSAKLLLESRNQVWHERKTSKYSSQQFCMWFKFRWDISFLYESLLQTFRIASFAEIIIFTRWQHIETISRMLEYGAWSPFIFFVLNFLRKNGFSVYIFLIQNCTKHVRSRKEWPTLLGTIHTKLTEMLVQYRVLLYTNASIPTSADKVTVNIFR